MNSGGVLHIERHKVTLKCVTTEKKQIQVLPCVLIGSPRFDLKRNLQFPFLGREGLH